MSKIIKSPVNEMKHLYNNSSQHSDVGLPEEYLPMSLDEPMHIESWKSTDGDMQIDKINKENFPPSVDLNKELSFSQSTMEMIK